MAALRGPEVVATEPDNCTEHYIGIGLNGLSYWDGSHALADLQGHGQYCNTSWGLSRVDTNGWPLEDVRLLVSSDQLAGGTYLIQLQGQVGQISPSYGSISNLTYYSSSNFTKADWVLSSKSSGNVWIDFYNTRRTNGASLDTGFVNLHIWRPGMPGDGSVRFTPEYLAAAGKFNLVRGMDMVAVNGSPARYWSDRSLMAWAGQPVDTTNSPWAIAYAGSNSIYNGTATNTYWPGGFVSTRGHPWELLVLIANATSNDLWLNIPVRVDDDYVTKLAQLVRYGSDGVNPYTNTQAHPVYPPLNRGLKLYLEYGNEVWNTGPGFHCFNWVKDLSDAARTDAGHPICYDGVPSDYNAVYRYTAYRSSTLSLIFRKVFGDDAMMTTVRPILSSQAGNANEVLQTGLQWAEGFYGSVRASNAVARPVSDLWYGGGGAAYYDSTVEPFVLSTNNGTVTASTTAERMTEYFAGLPNTNFAIGTATDATWTKAYGLKLTSYEGGPGPGGSSLGGVSGAAVSPLYNADPRMKQRMLVAQDVWIANGGDLLTYYVLAGDGPWGFGDSTNTVMSSNTVKLQAIDVIHSATKTDVTLGTLVPAAIALTSNPAAGMIATGGYADTNNGMLNLSAQTNPANGPLVLVPLRTTMPGAFKFQLDYRADSEARVELLVNGVSAGSWTLPGSGSLASSARLTANLTNGLNVARLRMLSGLAALHDLTVMSYYNADPPAFSPAAGTYNTSVYVTLSSTTAGASFYYTTNGTEPSATNGTLYTQPVFLPVSATIKAVAAAQGMTNSLSSSASYVINNIYYGALVGWDFAAAGGNAATDGNVATVDSTYNAAGIQSGTLSRGAGAGAAALQWATGEGAVNTHGLTADTLAAAKSAGGCFQFTLAPSNGWQMAISALRYAAYMQNAHTSATLVTEYSTNAFATAGTALHTNNAIPSGWNGGISIIDLSGIAALQRTTNAITFRLWGYGFGGYEDAGLGEVSGDNLDLAVLGTASLAPGSSVTLSCQRQGTSLLLSWPQGTLLEADEVAGPWSTNTASSPYLIAPTAPKKFFRLRLDN